MATKEETFDPDQWLGSTERTTHGSAEDEFLLLGNRNQGEDRDGRLITSYSAIRVSDNKQMRIALPSEKLLKQFKQKCFIEKDGKDKVKAVRLKANYDLEERKGSYWINKVLPYE